MRFHDKKRLALRHSYFSDVESVIHDIRAMFEGKQDAETRGLAPEAGVFVLRDTDVQARRAAFGLAPP